MQRSLPPVVNTNGVPVENLTTLALDLPWGYDGAVCRVEIQSARRECSDFAMVEAVVLSHGTIPEADRATLGAVGERICLLVETKNLPPNLVIKE